MKKILTLFLLLNSILIFSQTPEDSKKKYPIRDVIKKNNTVVSTSATPITDANFQTAINTCLATNPVDGMCSDSEYGAMPDWDVSQVNDMSYAFRLKTNFNGDLSAWDVSNVTTMFQMFGLANNFNGNISAWDVSNVTIMQYMFSDATSFNQPLEDWDVSNVTEMRDLFSYSSFNQDISGWCVSNIVSEPSDFSTGSPLIESNKPVWGTCANSSSDYNFCDDDGDGIMTIDLTTILDEVQVAVSGDLQVADPKLLIGTSEDKLLQIDNILLNPITTVLCELPDNTYDVAMNSSLHYYSTNFNSIDYVDDLTCQLSSQLNIGGNSLSFDTQDNLYFNALGAGTASTSAVYRLNPEPGATPYIWHDFNSGTAGGDFVIFGNFMYIAWKFNEDVLLKVTIDDDVNYISHEVLGPLKFNTFGLASEQGVLYGITEEEIYKINLATSPPSFETILQNDYTHGAWYGSAGFSEAIAFSSSAHISQLDADNNDNTLPNPWVNTVPGEQTIFIRTEEVSEDSNYTVTPVTITISPTPSVTTTPPDLETCDFDGNGIELFDLTPQTNLIFGAQDSTIFEVIYSTENTFTNLIATPQNYLCTSPLETIFFRIINSSESTCFSEGEFNLNLVVTNTEIPTTFQRSFSECDDFLDINGNDTANNDDTDGVSSFDFSSVTNEIVALFPASQTINVSYYESLADANVPINPIFNTIGYRNIASPFTQQIFIRVDNPANVSCAYVGTHITLSVNPVPEIDVIPNLDICDDANDGDDTNGFVQSIDLESHTTIILGTQDPTNFTVTYHSSESDAISGSSSLSSPFTNTTVDQQTIYVRVINNSTGCLVDRLSFDVVINPLPIITDAVELKQCDDDTDGFSLFNLNEAATDISTNYLNETFVFYPSLVDAENDTNAYTPTEALAFRNRFVTTDTVWARAISGFGCYRIAEVNLVVSTTGLPATFQRSFTLCDDFLDIDGNDTVDNDDTDGVAAFNFSSVTAEVRALFPASQQLTITYYRNQADALAEVDAITDTANYRNIGYPSTQQIYIRVDSDLDNDCLGFGPFITLTVDPVPTVNPYGDLILCDNGDDGDFINGIVQTFNLESQTPIILGTQDPLNFTVTYHTSDADALSGANQILNTTMYENTIPNLETIYVRVANNTTTCFTNHTSFDLIVNELPIANFVDDLEVCDDNTDGSAQNGFSQEFDLELQTAGILGSQDPTQFSVTYHASLADAQANILPLGSPFSNSVPFSQIIYARVYNALTGCANGISNFNAIVNPEPTTENASNLSFCDDDLDGDDTNGFIQNIDLDSQITEILGTLQDPDDFTVTFHETQADATDGTDALSSPYTNTTADQQTIFVRVVNDDTLCVNDDFTFDVIINPLPDFKVTSPQIVCLSGPPLTLFVENPAAVYDYVWTAPNGNESFGSQITIESGGLYTVTATTTSGTLCARTREIQVNESIVATITDADVTIVDDSENNSISIDPTNLGIGDYQYALINEDGIQTSFQDIPLFENLTGGFYTIVVEDKNGCRPNATLEVSVIEYPKFFTPNNDGINDTWAIKGANSTFYPTAQINIFNRFGKVVAQIEVDSPGWTGTYGGKTLPSNDYWFSIVLVDRNGNARERKGNFSLLRR